MTIKHRGSSEDNPLCIQTHISGVQVKRLTPTSRHYSLLILILMMTTISGCANPQRLYLERQGVARVSKLDMPGKAEYGLSNEIARLEESIAGMKEEQSEHERKSKEASKPKTEEDKKATLAREEAKLTVAKKKLTETKMKRDGIFSCSEYEETSSDPCVYVKSRGKPLITIIDDAARMRRFNYTVTTDISRFYVDIFDDSINKTDKKSQESPLVTFQKYGYSEWNELPQKKFQSMDEFVRTLIKTIKTAYKYSRDKGLRTAAANLDVRWIGDGYLFYDRTNDPERKKNADVKTNPNDTASQPQPSSTDGKNNETGSNPEQQTAAKDDGVTDDSDTDDKSEKYGSKFCIELIEKIEKNPDNPKWVKLNDIKKHPKEYDCLNSDDKTQKGRRKDQMNKTIAASKNNTTQESGAKDKTEKNPPGESDDTVTFKKIFLFNLSQKEVAYYLSRLFNLPYSDFQPEFSARQLTQYISMTDGKLLDKMPNNDYTRTFITPPDDYVIKPEITSVGRVISLPQQNALIIKGEYNDLKKISQVLYAIDAEYRQIMIEAKVFEYDSSLSKRVGMTLDLSKTFGGSPGGSFGIKNSALEREFGSAVASALPYGFFNLSDAEQKLSLLTSLALYDRDGLVKITAEPRLVVKPGQESVIDLSTTKHVQVVTDQNNNVTSDLKQVPTGVVLVIRPILLSDDKVQLDFILRQSEFVPSQESGVQLETKSNQVLSSLVVQDGELVTIGGIEMQKFNHALGGYPLLKDIPLFGSLFGGKSSDFTSTRIEFMIRPTIKDIGLKRHQIHDQIVTYENDIKPKIEAEHMIGRKYNVLDKVMGSDADNKQQGGK